MQCGVSRLDMARVRCLLFWRFEDDRSGLLARGPDREEVAWVWHNILDPNLVFRAQ